MCVKKGFLLLFLVERADESSAHSMFQPPPPRLSKVQLSEDTIAFIHSSTNNYGKVKLVLKQNRFFMESGHPEVLNRLLQVYTRARLYQTSLLSAVVVVVEIILGLSLAAQDPVIEEAAADGGIIREAGDVQEFEVKQEKVRSATGRHRVCFARGCRPSAAIYIY